MANPLPTYHDADEYNLCTVIEFPDGGSVAVVAPDMNSLTKACNRITRTNKSLNEHMVQRVLLTRLPDKTLYQPQPQPESRKWVSLKNKQHG